MAILNFEGRVNIAVRIVTEKYPNAKLYEAQGVSSTGATTDPLKIDELTVVFQNSNNTTVTIKSIGWGEFGEPKLINEPYLGDVVIEWPANMDLKEANDLKEKAGYKEAYKSVVLRNPLGPTIGNPYYIFTCNEYIFVDTVTKKVEPSKRLHSQVI